MSGPSSPAIFHGHNDVLLRLWSKFPATAEQHFLAGNRASGDHGGHLDLPRMREGGFAGGMFAIFVPSRTDEGLDFGSMSSGQYDTPLPREVSYQDALPAVMQMAGILARIEAASDGAVKVCRTAADIQHCLDNQVLAVVLHIEGAEAIDEDFITLDALYQLGLRSVGPVWSRPTRYGHGVPFRFPGSPDTGDGLTPAGRDLIKALNKRKMLIDLSHLNEKGFWDIASLSDAPLVATHSNAHAISQSTRNLTDKQLHAIAESRGMVGVNFATSFLRKDGRMSADTSLDLMLEHIDHLVNILGEDGVGFGSDFDGAIVPAEIGDATGLISLRAAMQKHGYNDTLMKKLCHGNWVSVLSRTLQE